MRRSAGKIQSTNSNGEWGDGAVRYSEARTSVSRRRRTSGSPALDFRSNQTDGIEILDMYPILEPVTGQFHSHQIGDRCDQDAFLCSIRLRGPAGKDQVNR